MYIMVFIHPSNTSKNHLIQGHLAAGESALKASGPNPKG
jgi:hypothetical protein